jgi:hypothetical protein
MSETLRIGCGAAGEPDRPDLAMQMVLDGDVEVICFDTLAERTLASAQQRRVSDPSLGYDLMLRERVGAILVPALGRGMRIAGNMGGANPVAAAAVLLDEARRTAVPGLTIAVVRGDDILQEVLAGELPIGLWDGSVDLGRLRTRLVSANVYLGFPPILEAMRRGADVVVTGRSSDVAPYMAAILHRFNWDPEDWDALAVAAVIGHLLECGRCVTGTCYEEPAFGRLAPDPGNVSMPLAEVAADGSAVISKVPDTGGLVTRGSCAEQLIHEVGDPSSYLTPDVTLDMTKVTLEQIGADRVRVSGARGAPPPDTFKVLLGVDDGWIVEGEASFAGLGAVDKARLAARIVRERLDSTGFRALDYRADLIGLDSVLGPATPPGGDPFEVRLRIAARVGTEEETHALALECQDLWWAPGVGGGGVRTAARPVVGMYAASIPRDRVNVVVDVTSHRLTDEASLAGR